MIRRAEPRDSQAIMSLLQQVNRVHWEGRPDLFRLGTKYTEDTLGDIIRDDTRPIFVYENEAGQVLGYAFCVHQQHVNDQLLTDIKTLYIDDLCVEENARGQHIGRQLYQHVLDYAREKGCYNVTLNVWALNKSAMAFYEKCGLQVQKVGMECIL